MIAVNPLPNVLPVSSFSFRTITIDVAVDGALVRGVPALQVLDNSSGSGIRVYALRTAPQQPTNGNQTLLGSIELGEVVVPAQSNNQENGDVAPVGTQGVAMAVATPARPVYVCTGQQVMVKRYVKSQIVALDPRRPGLVREDPFKEIALEAYLQSQDCKVGGKAEFRILFRCLLKVLVLAKNALCMSHALTRVFNSTNCRC